jgi:hypothetical protein
MKILKIVLIVIVCLIAIPFIAAIFVPRSYTVSVTETINRPRQEVHDFVRLLDNQRKYSVWIMADPALVPEITGTDGSVGAIQKWNSKLDNVGEGEQEITAITPERIDVTIRFKRPFESTAKAANIFKSVSENQTQVTSEFYSNNSYPMNLPSYLFGRKILQDAELKNLQNIKRILEDTGVQ